MDERTVEKQVLYTGKKVHLELHHVKDSDGGKHTREVVVHPGAAVILPVLPNNDILLIRTYRYAVREHLLELPAGTIDPGETPINCAGRELVEETGYIASKLQRIGSFYSSPGILTEKMHAFLATGLLPSAGPTDETEQIELQPMSLQEALRLVTEGDIVDGKTITTLLLFDAKRKAAR
jgi:ADP-ribose pyrophosphatase